MRVLIVEPDGRGHRLYYVRLIAVEALRCGAAVRIVVGDGDHIESVVTTHLSSLEDQVEVVQTPITGWVDIETAAGEFEATLTVVPEADGHLLSVARRRGWRGPGQLSLLVMRLRVPPVGHRVRRLIADTVKVALIILTQLRPEIRIHVLRSVFAPSGSPWPTVADPVGMSAAASDADKLRARWGIDPTRYWFGALGAITSNKNVPLLLDVILSTDFPRPVGVLVAGGIEPSVAQCIEPFRDSLAAAGVTLLVVDRLLEDLELDAAIRAVDCLILAYQHLGSSGTLGKAVAAGTRVVTAGSRTLRHDAATVGAGASWCPMTTEALSKALVAATRKANPSPRDLADESTFARTILGLDVSPRMGVSNH